MSYLICAQVKNMPGKDIRIDTRQRIKGAIDSGMSATSVATAFAVSRSTVYRISASGDNMESRRNGREAPNLLRTEEFRQDVAAAVADNPRTSIRRLGKEFDVSDATMRRTIADLGLKSYALPQRQLVTPRQRETRVDRCRILLNSLRRAPGVIFFTDEKVFTQDIHINRRNDRILALSIEDRDEHTVFKSKHPASIMCFGLVASDGNKMPLVMFEPHTRLNCAGYIEVLEQVKSWILERYPESNDGSGNIAADFRFRFQQDGAPAHTALRSQQWLLENFGARRFWDKDSWPPSSPDANPLDYSIWNQIVSVSNHQPHNTLESLRNSVTAAWNDMNPEFIRKACGAFRGRLEKIIATDGLPLSS